MSKETSEQEDSTILTEYDFTKGIRGKYANRYVAGQTLVLLEPDVARVFPDAASVNEALRALISVAKRATSDTAV